MDYHDVIGYIRLCEFQKSIKRSKNLKIQWSTVLEPRSYKQIFKMKIFESLFGTKIYSLRRIQTRFWFFKTGFKTGIFIPFWFKTFLFKSCFDLNNHFCHYLNRRIFRVLVILRKLLTKPLKFGFLEWLFHGTIMVWNRRKIPLNDKKLSVTMTYYNAEFQFWINILKIKFNLSL